MSSRCLLFVSLCLTSLVLAAQPIAPTWPEIRQETKPWSRWWWLGNIADEKSLTSEMEKYAAAGLGGLEITPIYGVRGYEDRFVPFLSPRWMELFTHTLSEARRLHLGIDLATGTGWPFGGPWLNDTDVAHYLAHQVYTVRAGDRLTEPVKFFQAGLVRYAGPRRTPLDELKQPVTANPNLQELALDQVRFERPLPLVSLMAFPAQSAASTSLHCVDLTSKVDPAGHLDWTAPVDGAPWTVYALFQGQHGKMVERAAPGGEGYALDHLSSEALAHYLGKFDAAFANHSTGGLRAFFNDSYEVDDSQGEADFTPRFFEQFRRRRGYDLRTRLPELFAATSSDASARVLSDYRETISDLLLDEFTTPWRKWAGTHGALIRNQPHGSPANILDLYAASDIPEQEGNGFLAIKFASSAAHLTGKPLASSETATWLDEHFLSTLAELKSSVDTFLLGGINHNCYHGTAFSPPDDPWPGFQFYASVELNPANPFWNDFAIVNAYVTRAQSFLQSGSPDEEVLLYYNIHDRWAERGDGTLPHFGHGRDPVGTSAGKVAAELHETGFGFDYVSDRLLAGVTCVKRGASDSHTPQGRDHTAAGRLLRSGNANYRAIVVPATTFMPEATLNTLITLAKNGATILVLQHLPEDAPGLHARHEAFAQRLAEIRAHAVEQDGVTVAKIGAGQFVIGPDLHALLATRSDLPRESMRELGLEFVRRRTDAGATYFIVNHGPKPIEQWIPLHTSGKAAALFDPMTGQSGVAAFRSAPGGTSQVYVQLAPNESRIVQLYAEVITNQSRWTYWTTAGESQPLSCDWSIAFVRGGPNLPASTKMAELKSWTELGGEDVKAFSGTATYTLAFTRPPGSAAAYALDLGQVADSARVVLNGREVGALIQPPWRVVVPTAALLERNTLDVSVTNLAANRIADLDRRGVPWKKFYNVNMPARRRENAGADGLFSAANWKPRNSGLLGPVMLTPLRALDPGQ